MVIASEFRISGNKRVEEIKEKGKIIQSESFGVLYLENSEKNLSRFAFVISTKISKLAVQRNRIERAMSEAIRYNMNDIKKGYDIVFLTKTKISSMTTDQIMKEVEKFVKSFNP
jgi:ribonuclease P protein component